MIWPPDYHAIWEDRYNRAGELEKDPELLFGAKEYYKDNPIDYINDWGVTYDPRVEGDKILPMVLFQRQIDFLQCLHECYIDRENMLNEKSRDMGVTWLCCGFTDWLWTFHSNTAIGWGSRKGEYVDKSNDPKAIFPKLRMILEYKPRVFMPRGFRMDIHAPYMRIINPENGSTVTGEAGDNIGRGGRTSIYFKDEAAHYDSPESIEAALADNTDVQIDISSVNGTGNVFYRRRMVAEVWERGVKPERGKTRAFIMDWRDHPGKTQEWYDLRRKRAEEEGLLHLFAQEVDRDYAASVEGVIIQSIWVDAAIDAHLKLKITIEGEKTAMQDVADDGGDKNALVMRHGILCTYAEHWAGEAGEAAKKSVPIANEFGVREFYYDSIGVGVGFKVQCNTMKDWPTWNPNLIILPWNAGGAVLHPDKPSIKGDKGSPLNKDQYKNLKAQAWFRTASRFYKTYRAVVHGDVFPPDELISIDSGLKHLHQLKMELSQPVRKQNDVGKFTVDKKPDGTYSPNLADAFVACYNPTRKVTGFDVL